MKIFVPDAEKPLQSDSWPSEKLSVEARGINIFCGSTIGSFAMILCPGRNFL
jgi:hypothetical protein